MRSATRRCGRSGACGGKVSSVPDRAVLGAESAPGPAGPMLTVRDLSVEYVMERGTVTAVDDVSFELDPGKVLGIVGESGCGKSTLLFAVAQLLAPPASAAEGSLTFKGPNMVGMTDKE